MDRPKTVERFIIEDSTLTDEEKIDRLAHVLDPENWMTFERMSCEVEEDFMWEDGTHVEQTDDYWEKILNSAYEKILSRHPELDEGDLDDEEGDDDDEDGDDGLPF